MSDLRSETSKTENWIEDVVNGIALFEGVPVHVDNLQAEGPGQKDEPQRPAPDIPVQPPADVPAPHPTQPEIVPPHETPDMDPATPSAPEA
jgi:hypothetical protein